MSFLITGGLGGNPAYLLTGGYGSFGTTPTWQIMVGTTSNVLTIADVQSEDMGRKFRCVVSGVNEITSNTVTIIAE